MATLRIPTTFVAESLRRNPALLAAERLVEEVERAFGVQGGQAPIYDQVGEDVSSEYKLQFASQGTHFGGGGWVGNYGLLSLRDTDEFFQSFEPGHADWDARLRTRGRTVTYAIANTHTKDTLPVKKPLWRYFEEDAPHGIDVQFTGPYGGLGESGARRISKRVEDTALRAYERAWRA